MTFGSRLKQLRQAKGLTQTQLGLKLGAHNQDAGKQVVMGWEKDQHFPKVDQLVLICNRLDCSADFLLFGETRETGLSPEAIQVARTLDSFTGEDRRHVLTHWLETARFFRQARENKNTNGVSPARQNTGNQ